MYTGLLPYIPLEMCDPINVTFLFQEENRFISWNINYFTSDCTFIINISSCPPSDTDPCIINVGKEYIDEDRKRVMVPLNECLKPSNQYSSGVTVDVRFNHTNCTDDNNCKARDMYLPKVKDTG